MSTVSPLLRGQGLPEFRAISPELVSTDIPVLLAQLDQDFTALEQALESALAGPSKLSWDRVMQPLQAIGERLRWSWGVVSHLNGVCNSAELRDAHAAQQPSVASALQPPTHKSLVGQTIPHDKPSGLSLIICFAAP